MKNFRVEVTKGVEKFVFIKQAEAEILLREALHKEGYSILSIEKIDNLDISGNKYYFDFLDNGTLKTGSISSNDIFKSYLKIKYGMGYDLKYIYPEKDNSIEKKQKIIHDLEQQYLIYLEANKKDLKKEQEKDSKKTTINRVEEKTDSFYIKKELDKTYKIIEKILLKIKNISSLGDDLINFERKHKLEKIYNELIKLKGSTNLIKLKQIGEIGLVKIGEIEVEILKNKKDNESKLLLKETNKLLRELGSKKNFNDFDLNKILKNIINFFTEKDKQIKKVKKKSVKIDKRSTEFLSTKLLYEKYKSKLKSVNKEKLKNFIIYIVPSKKNKEKIENYRLKNIIIKRNIAILQTRLTNTKFSYVKIALGYNYIIKKLLEFFNFIFKILLVFDIFYVITFLIFILLTFLGIRSSGFNYIGLFYFIYANLSIFLLLTTRGIFSLIFNVVFLIFLFIFGVINI